MPSAPPIIIEARDLTSRDDQLEQAINILRHRATDSGILITRHSFRTFTAALNADVEFGFIQELDLL